MARLPFPVRPRPRRSDRDGAESFTLPLCIQSLGAARVVLGEDQVVPSTGTLFALLLRVAYSPELRVRRDELLRVLWPGMTPERQRGNLRQTLYKARALGIDVSLAGDSVRLSERQVVRTFSLEQSTALFDRDVVRGNEPFGVFLPSYTVPWPEFQEWVDAQRQTVHAAVRKVLVELLRARLERADWTGAERLARWLLQFDSLNEEATFTVAECTLLAGSKTEAVAILDRYLEEIGPEAGDIRLPATLLRKRFTEPPTKKRTPFVPTDRHFVGRTTELANLTMAMRRARWYDGSAVLVSGPSGIGKTRLANELSKVAQLEGFREIRNECREMDIHRPLSALIEPLSELLELRGALGCSPESMAILRRVLGVSDDSAASDKTSALASQTADARKIEESRGQSVRHAVMDLIGAVTEERPLLLILENVDFIDDDSWDVLMDLAERITLTRVFLLVSSRTTPRPTKRLAKPPASLQLVLLEPMLPHESLSLARLISNELAAPLMPATEDWIVSASEGNPFFLRALVNHWVETGDAAGIPPTLQVLLDQRIERLSPAAIRALQTISLLDAFASLDRLIASLQLPTHELLEALDQLEKEGYLAHDDASLIVSHDLVGRAATNRMSHLVCAALRSSVADAFEMEFSRTGDVEALLQSLHHIEASGRTDQVVRFITKHADALIQSKRPRGVLRTLNRLLVGKTANGSAVTLRRIQSRLEHETGEYARSLSLGPSGILLPSNFLELREEDADAALSVVDAAFRADPFVDREELSDFATHLARAAHLSRAIRLRSAEIAIVIATNNCDRATSDSCYSAFAPTELELAVDEKVQRVAMLHHTVFGSIATATNCARSLIDRSRSMPPSTISFQDAGRAAFALRLCGHIEEARSAFLLSHKVAMEIEAPRHAQFTAWQLANMSLELGNDEDANHWTDVLTDLFQSEQDDIASSFVVAFFCRMAIHRGNQQLALELFARCRRAYPRFPTLKATTYLVALELGAQMLNPEWIPSDALLEVAKTRFVATASFGTSDFYCSMYGSALLRAGRDNEAFDTLSHYLHTMRRDKSPLAVDLASLARNVGLSLPA